MTSTPPTASSSEKSAEHLTKKQSIDPDGYIVIRIIPPPNSPYDYTELQQRVMQSNAALAAQTGIPLPEPAEGRPYADWILAVIRATRKSGDEEKAECLRTHFADVIGNLGFGGDTDKMGYVQPEDAVEGVGKGMQVHTGVEVESEM